MTEKSKRQLLNLQIKISTQIYKKQNNCAYFFLDILHEDMEFLEVLTEGLTRVLMVRGGGTEVITMYS